MASHSAVHARANGLSAVDPMNAGLCRNWSWMLVRGMLAIVFGALTLLMPIVALRTLILLFGAYLLADGIVGIIAAVRAARAEERWRWLVFEGLLGIVAGGLAIALPGIALLGFVLLASAWATLTGIAMLLAAVRLHKERGRGWMALAGPLSILWGGLLFLGPIAGAIVLTLWIGAYALAFGILLVVLSLRLRARRAQPETLAADANSERDRDEKIGEAAR